MKTALLRSKRGEILKVKELWSEEKIQDRVLELSTKIATYYKEKTEWKEGEKIVIVAILDGAIFFAVDLLRKLVSCFPLGTFEIETFGIESYRGEYPGKVRITKDLKRPIERKHVLIVEDIIDTGQTLDELKKKFKIQKPKTLTFCVLIDKRSRRRKKVKVDFVGFVLEEDWWLIGYGLDWKGLGRELPWIGRK